MVKLYLYAYSKAQFEFAAHTSVIFEGMDNLMIMIINDNVSDDAN